MIYSCVDEERLVESLRAETSQGQIPAVKFSYTLGVIPWFRLLGLELDGSSVDSRPVGLKENGGDRVCENVAVPTNHHLHTGRCLLSHSPVQDFLCVYSSGKRQTPRRGFRCCPKEISGEVARTEANCFRNDRGAYAWVQVEFAGVFVVNATEVCRGRGGDIRVSVCLPHLPCLSVKHRGYGLNSSNHSGGGAAFPWDSVRITDGGVCQSLAQFTAASLTLIFAGSSPAILSGCL